MLDFKTWIVGGMGMRQTDVFEYRLSLVAKFIAHCKLALEESQNGTPLILQFGFTDFAVTVLVKVFEQSLRRCRCNVDYFSRESQDSHTCVEPMSIQVLWMDKEPDE